LLKKLTPEQVLLAIQVRDEWLNHVFKSDIPLDKELAIEGVKWLYSLAKMPTPYVVVLDSPRSCQIAANILKKETLFQVEEQVWNEVGAQVAAQVAAQVGGQVGDQVRDQVADQVWNQVGAQVRDQVRGQVWNQVWNQVRDQVADQVGEQVWNQVEDQVADQVWEQVRGQVWNEVGAQVRAQVAAQVWNEVGAQVAAQVRAQVAAQVWNQVGAQVGDQVAAQVWRQKLEYFTPAAENLLTDSGWVPFYDYFKRINIVEHKLLDKYMEYLKNGVFYTIFLGGAAFLCGRPEYIKRDEQNRLHCEDGPAIRWKDGYCNYFWHGVSVPEKLIERPDEITKEDLINETNAEVRRGMMEKLGERFYSLLDVFEVARETMGQGEFAREAVLYRSNEPDPVAGEYIQYVQVTCHSTGRQFTLCVPPNIETPGAAVAWTFGKTESDYAPIVEA
jgi:hypothetical protein